MKIPITVVIPTKNEEKNLEQCLAQLSLFERVVIIDSCSKDNTRSIAATYGAEIIDFAWNGLYPKKRNWFLLNYEIHTDWVLFLDADEIVNPEFCNIISKKISDIDCDAFWLYYDNYFLGNKLKWGLKQRKLALFRTPGIYYEKIKEETWSNLDMEIHEHPIVKGSISSIPISLKHDDKIGLEKFLLRHIEYAKWEAKRYTKLGDFTSLNNRQRFKYRYLEMAWFPVFYFILTYFLKLGILDGKTGFKYAFFKAYYFYTIRLLIKQYKSEY
jgi:glycosyltransferase involved in cell wall biosynthesis